MYSGQLPSPEQEILAHAIPGGPFASLTFDDFDLPSFTAVASSFGQDSYGFVVTPNVDHIIRFNEEASFRDLYAAASYVLLDSRFANALFQVFKGRTVPVCTGSDLVASLLKMSVRVSDRIVLIGGTESSAQHIANTYGLKDLRHHNPPMGFIKDPQAVATCLQFIEDQSPFRFCFLAIGSPQQEAIAARLRERGRARGLALCIGAAVNFVTGVERRAPEWIQHLALEWLYRLIQNPRRLARRYLIRGPKIFRYLLTTRVEVRSSARPTLPSPMVNAPPGEQRRVVP